MTAAVLRTVIMKCTALFYSVAYGGVILYMVVVYCICHTTKFISLILWYSLMTAACNVILVTSE